MPSFGRLGKHSNRSQHALTDALAAGAGSGSGGNSASSAVSASGSGSNRGAAAGYANANAASTATPPSALSSSHNTAFSSNESFDSRSQQQQQFPPQQQQKHQLLQTQQPQLAPSSPAGQQRAPPQLYSSPSAASSTTSANPPPLQQHNPAGAEVGGSPIFDGQQQHPHQLQHQQHQQQQQQQHQLQYQNQSDFADSAGVSRSSQQSNRYSKINSQSPYGNATDSADNLSNYGPGSAPLPPQQQQQQPPPPQGGTVPEKRSKRGLIKNIFSGSSRASSDQQQQQQQQQQHHHHGISIGHSHQESYDNTTGLARRPSKRVSNPPTPAIKTTFSQIGSDRSSGPAVAVPQAQIPAQIHQARQQQDYHPNPSPLQNVDEVEDYYTGHESNIKPPSQNSRVSLNPNTIRQVSSEIDQTVYEDVAYRPQQQQQAPPQPHVQVHPQDQQHQQTRYDKGAYDQASPQNSQQQSLPPPPSQQYPLSNSNSNQQQQAQYQQGGDPRIIPSHLIPSQHQNPETVSQFSHESPITDSDQRSAHLQSASTSPAVKHSVYIQNHGSTPSLPPIPVQQTTPQPQQQSGMAPPGGGPPPSRRQDSEKSGRGPVEPTIAPPPAYRHSQASMNTMSPLPPVPPQLAGQSPNYRGDRPPPQFEGQVGDQGRNSPQPSTSTTDPPSENDKAFKDLLIKYKNVKRLYFDGKSQIEGLTGQIEHLQNAVANQRMSQSRTVLDDSEYQTRFNRLNGAINNLSFNIRKDWRSVPQWLKDYVSADALKTGKQEMTAIGRAVISLWLVEEIFNKCFHPGLDPVLSQHLKEIELSIRKSAYKLSSQEEFEAFTNKVVSWRMTTLEGLSQQLNSPATVDNRTSLIEKATGNLTARLFQFLNDPPPTGVQGSTSMIVELAVGIANNIPLESRDVGLHYPMPGDLVQPHLMEVEKTPLPLLEGQKAEDEVEGEQDEVKDKNGKAPTDKPKPGTLKKSIRSSEPQASREGSNVSAMTVTGITHTDMDAPPVLPQDSNRVRFAGFIALEVRGRQVLAKAPVWTL